MRYALTLAAMTLALPLMLGTQAIAGANCTQKTDEVNGKFGGAAFGAPADTRSLGIGDDDNFARIQSEDCDTISGSSDAQEARLAGRRAASIGAAMDAYGWGEGLNLTLNGANTALGNDDTYAAGLVTGYKHTFGQPLGGVIYGIAGKAGFSADTTGSDMGASVGVTLNFGTF